MVVGEVGGLVRGLMLSTMAVMVGMSGRDLVESAMQCVLPITERNLTGPTTVFVFRLLIVFFLLFILIVFVILMSSSASDLPEHIESRHSRYEPGCAHAEHQAAEADGGSNNGNHNTTTRATAVNRRMVGAAALASVS